MKIFLVGEAAEHDADLRPHLDLPADVAVDVVGLPADAASSNAHDARIGRDDVVVSLRFRRPGGRAPVFRLLHVPGAGLDGIDLDALDPATAVANVFEHEIPIAEFVLARLLEWRIRAEAMTAAFTPEAWPEQYRHRRPHGELYGTTLGVLGYGRIGRAVAARAAAFGVRVVAVDESAGAPGLDTGPAEVVAPERLAEVLPALDHLVVACPLTERTTGMVDAAALARMAPHAVLVNVSRAGVVDEDALHAALVAGRLGGAILDVWYRYPAPGEGAVAPARLPFWDLPGVWCTPHSAAWTRELSQRRYARIAENVNALVAGRPLRDVVRAPAPTR